MAKVGKFVWQQAYADLLYTASQGDMYEIINSDIEGYKFLDSLDVGDEIALRKSDGDKRMVVTDLDHRGPWNRCQAKAL